MDKIRIRGGAPLKGAVYIGGAKNAALPLMAAALLTSKPLTLFRLPYLADITTMARLLVQHGVGFCVDGTHGDRSRVVTLEAKEICNVTAPYDLVRTMRASVLVLGPLLARCGKAKVSLPGGCAIGTRPIDMHIKALCQMGADIRLEEGYMYGEVKGRLQGCDITFEKVSVGATENILMAATLARGITQLNNAAREPEIQDLAHCLVKMGAKITGIGSATLVIEGVESLQGCEHEVVADRIEAGTYAVAAAITGGEITLQGVTMEDMHSFIMKMEEAGVIFTEVEDGIKVTAPKEGLKPVDITTQPFPGFPTDMQAQMMALMSLAPGASTICETIFENRFMHVPELSRMGADIQIHGNTAMVRGKEMLRGAEVMATDLRASVSLVLAALAAKGETMINRVYHIDRGYERIGEKLRMLGADMERIKA